jgi:hypothetical protein
MRDTTPTIRWSNEHERDAASYYAPDDASKIQHNIGVIMFQYKLRLEAMQEEWEAVRLLYESNLPDKKKYDALQRQDFLRMTLVNQEADKNVQSRRCTCGNHNNDSDDNE